MPSFHDFRFLSTDGKHKVFARECTPDGEVRAVLQIAHGVAEHIYRYAPFMEFLANHGFVVVANDHLGHGKTAENEQELCFFAEKDGWNDVVSDMDQLHKLTAAKYPDVPQLPLFLQPRSAKMEDRIHGEVQMESTLS